jgi:hypothetical protein
MPISLPNTVSELAFDSDYLVKAAFPAKDVPGIVPNVLYPKIHLPILYITTNITPLEFIKFGLVKKQMAYSCGGKVGL